MLTLFAIDYPCILSDPIDQPPLHQMWQIIPNLAPHGLQIFFAKLKMKKKIEILCMDKKIA